MTRRPTWSRKQRAEIFRDAKDICHICTVRIETWQDWHVEHPKARGFKGSDKQEDMRPAHIDCHQVKTSAERKIMAKADRQAKSHLGLKKQGPGMPGTKRSKFKKHMDGRVTLR